MNVLQRLFLFIMLLGLSVSTSFAQHNALIGNLQTGQTVITNDTITQVTQLLMAGRGSILDTTFSPDGQTIAVASSVGIWLYDAQDDSAQPRFLNGHTGIVSTVAYSPDGSRIISGAWDNTVRVWDATTGELLLTLTGHTEAVNSVMYSPDGSRIASGADDSTVRVWGISE
ncbi:MAG: hypothetical protein SFZ02_10575 [bacterium]|nr:hypothetical protein [bacterium]